MWKSSGKLADGREIIYFDESPGQARADVPDTRPLAPMPSDLSMPESALRWDPLVGEWVVIAAQRQDRTFLPPPEACPLDPSAPGRPTEIPAPSYDVVVFENRFPSLRGTVPPTSELAEPGLMAVRPAAGRCEVVCFTADHNSSFAQLSPARVRTVLEAWVDRSIELGAMPGIGEVYCFENRGREIGVTLSHPHGQIYAFPFVTPRMRRMLESAREHMASTGGNLFDDMVAAEVADGSRIVARNEEWIAFVPAAARWPYEVMIFPARRVPDMAALDEPARDGFCALYLDVLGRLDALFDAPMPYIAAWHQAPVRGKGEAGRGKGEAGRGKGEAGRGEGEAGRGEGEAGRGDGEAGRREFGMHLQVLSVRRAPGKLKYLAGTESGTGAWSNDIMPETAAQRLREAR
ncbi:MAG: galactose-1-phosphate uridylyltransferase [Streptosporangiaceae bacterium]